MPAEAVERQCSELLLASFQAYNIYLERSWKSCIQIYCKTVHVGFMCIYVLSHTYPDFRLASEIRSALCLVCWDLIT